jgi:hypothetical protein
MHCTSLHAEAHKENVAHAIHVLNTCQTGSREGKASIYYWQRCQQQVARKVLAAAYGGSTNCAAVQADVAGCSWHQLLAAYCPLHSIFYSVLVLCFCSASSVRYASSRGVS